MKLSAFVLLLLLTSCLNEDSSIDNKAPQPEIYLAGSSFFESQGVTDIMASYWKNDERMKLPTTKLRGSNANFIVADENDVYVGGWVSKDDGNLNNKPVLWKNGILQVLPIPDTITNNSWTRVQSLFVIGNDVYVTGNIFEYFPIPDDPFNFNLQSSPLLWKNGDLVALDSMAGMRTHASFVTETDYYFLGEDGYWKNGIFVRIEASFIGDLTVKDNRVFLTGTDMNGLPGYWINGIDFKPIELSQEINQPRSVNLSDIKVNGDDVYVLGEVNIGGGPETWTTSINLWKNGEIFKILAECTNCSSTAISIYGGQPYIIGKTLEGGMLWRPEEGYKADKFYGVTELNSIFIR